MSYCEMFGFTSEGKMVSVKRYENAWGWAAYIWDKLFDKYLKDYSIRYDNWMGRSGDLWKLIEDDRLAPFEKVALWSTFTYSQVRVSELSLFIRSIEMFLGAYPAGEGTCHLGEIITDLMSVLQNPGKIISVGWYGMSVSNNPWRGEYDEEIDEYADYDVTTGTKHEFLGDFLSE